jgi:hypothetical protein
LRAFHAPWDDLPVFHPGEESKIDQQAALSWRKSSRCEMGNCVEVSFAADRVFLRDSKDKTSVLTLTRPQWTAFVAAVREGQLQA